MVGRFIHFYPAYTAEMVLAMPFVRFLALSRAITRLESLERLNRLEEAAVAAHPGKNGAEYERLHRLFSERAGLSDKVLVAQTSDLPVPEEDEFAAYELEPGSIEAERQRQKQAWALMLEARTKKP